MSGGSPASSPSKSRLVEALCIHLSERYPWAQRQVEASGRRGYTSRWRLILAEYSALRARLLNSHYLIENTNMALYVINEATLRMWFKDKVRREEVRLLLQGVSSLPQWECATNLPKALDKPTTPPDVSSPHLFEEPEDTTGQAVVRTR